VESLEKSSIEKDLNCYGEPTLYFAAQVYFCPFNLELEVFCLNPIVDILS